MSESPPIPMINWIKDIPLESDLIIWLEEILFLIDEQDINNPDNVKP